MSSTMPRLAPTVSAIARQTMRVAFEDLERTITPVDTPTLNSITSVQQVRAAVLDIEKLLAARQSLRNMRRLAPLLNGLEHYAKVIDILCNGTPYLAWIWAPITLILRVSSEYIEAFEQIMNGYSRIAGALGRFEILSDAFITNHGFQQTVAVFYADILQFHKHAYKFVRRSGWKLFFLTSWGRFQRRFENILDDLKRHGDLIDQEANARDISEARQMRQDLRTWREESLELVKRDENERAAKQCREIMSWLRLDESEQLSIYESISDEEAKFPGTCGWILKNSKVSTWLKPKPDIPFVWLQGNPGSGKSVLSTQLVRFLHAAKSSVISHFCTYTYVSSTKYENIVKSLLLQLLRRNGELVDYTYHECILGKKSPALSALEQLLQTVSLSMSDEPRETEYIWFVIDGLDECELERQPRLLSLLNQITANSSRNGETICKILISCRFSPTISKRLGKKQIVSLSNESEQLESAIQQYAHQRLRPAGERLRQLELGPDDIEEIERAIARKAAGMFLYARLVLDYLTTNIFLCRDELKESVHQLPPTLTDFYKKILIQILARQDSRSVDRIRCILGWIAFARRPLKKLEFLSAFTFSAGNPNISRLAPQYVLDICSPFIEERRDTTLTFIHVSVKEFLETSSSDVVLNEQDALREHGLASVTCLLSGLELFGRTINESTRFLRLIKGVHGFHVYATEFWTEYLLDASAATGGLDVSSSLFNVAYQLAMKLEELEEPTMPILATDSAVDQRLQSLRQHEVLHRHVESALKARSRKRLESEMPRQFDLNENSQPLEKPFALDGISTMLESYQRAVESILNQDSYPGVSAEELELFKSHFRTSAYTCRLRSCPRATIGFETEQIRQEHENIHVGGFKCTYAGCQYPPFRSAKSLKSHEDSCHKLVPPRKSIRRVGKIEFGMKDSYRPMPALQYRVHAINNSKTPLNSDRDALLLKAPVIGDGDASASTQGRIRPSPLPERDQMEEQRPGQSSSLDPLQKRKRRPSFLDNIIPKRAPSSLLKRGGVIPVQQQNETEATKHPPQPGSAGDEDNDEVQEAVTIHLEVRSDSIIPTNEGFKTHVRQLNPRLTDSIVERIAGEQMRRYERMLRFKMKHINAVKNRNCPSGKFCLDLGRELEQLLPRAGGKDSDAPPTGHQITAPGPSNNDDEPLPEGTVVSAEFPSGVLLPPVKRLPAQFECPLCYKVKKFYKQSDWTKHVHEDVRPFTCTFPICDESRSFMRKIDWIRHENEQHRQLEYWVCQIANCNHTCYRKNLFVQHLVQDHKIANDIWSLIARCRRDTTKQPKDEPCRFCGNILSSWKELTVHLSKHLEQISMPILPLLE